MVREKAVTDIGLRSSGLDAPHAERKWRTALR